MAQTETRYAYTVSVPPQDGKRGYTRGFHTSQEAQAFQASLSADKPEPTLPAPAKSKSEARRRAILSGRKKTKTKE